MGIIGQPINPTCQSNAQAADEAMACALEESSVTREAADAAVGTAGSLQEAYDNCPHTEFL